MGEGPYDIPDREQDFVFCISYYIIHASVSGYTHDAFTFLLLTAQQCITMTEFSFYPPNYTPAGVHQESHLTAPEAEKLSLSTVASSSNALSSLLMYGLSACDGGPGPRFKLGVFNPCGNRDGLTKVSTRQIVSTSTHDDVVFNRKSIFSIPYLTVHFRNIGLQTYSRPIR